MKKTLLLSVVASTMIMAGGSIAPVEPVVETPAPVAETAAWDFSGQAVVYYQTAEAGTGSLFEQANARANAGVQLRAVNKDLFAGIGAGVEVSGLATLGLQEDVVSGIMQAGSGSDAVGRGGWISQAYLTYAAGNTSFKMGRQELPKALSPFAFSEGWNVFKNTFDAALVVNSDIPDTTLVGAVVFKGNSNGLATDMSNFSSINPDGTTGDDTPVYMVTAVNKSVSDLALTGTYYYTSEIAANEDLNIFWADAKYNAGIATVALQGGTVMCDALADDTTAYGAKVAAKLGMVNASVAFSSVDEKGLGVFNVGGAKTPLYTQMVLNQGVIRSDADYVKVGASANVLGGTVIANYGYAVANNDDIVDGADNNPAELDLIYKTKVFNGSTTLLAAYVMVDPDTTAENTNVIRVWGRYNF